MRVHIRRFAREDINSAFDWYQEQDADLGTRFFAELEHVFERVALTTNRAVGIREPTNWLGDCG